MGLVESLAIKILGINYLPYKGKKGNQTPIPVKYSEIYFPKDFTHEWEWTGSTQ